MNKSDFSIKIEVEYDKVLKTIFIKPPITEFSGNADDEIVDMIKYGALHAVYWITTLAGVKGLKVIVGDEK